MQAEDSSVPAVAAVSEVPVVAEPVPAQQGEVCKFYARGDCRFGARCKKGHSGGVVQNSAGGNSRDHPRRAQGAGGRQPCRFFLAGNCKHSTGCKFDHIDGAAAGAAAPVGGGGGERKFENKRENQNRRQGRQGGDGVCWFFLRGDCKHGESCKFSHVAPVAAATVSSNLQNTVARQPCRFFLGGTCKYGQSCSFAHVVVGGEKEYAVEYDEAMYLHQQHLMMQQQMMLYQQQQQQQQYYHDPMANQ